LAIQAFLDGSGGVAPSTGSWSLYTRNNSYIGGFLQSGGTGGSTAATRWMGGTTSGAPSTGTYAVGDWVVDQTGTVWICTTAGTPGTWVNAGSNVSGGSTITGNLVLGGTLETSDTTWDSTGWHHWYWPGEPASLPQCRSRRRQYAW
jgi:hypothetical protein